MSYSDYMSCLYLEMCRVTPKHDATLGRYSTFIIACLWRARWRILRKLEARPRPESLDAHLDDLLPGEMDQALVTPAVDYLSKVCDAEFLTNIRSLVRERHWKFFWAYYAEDKTLQEIGDMHRLTRERIRQLATKTFERAQHWGYLFETYGTLVLSTIKRKRTSQTKQPKPTKTQVLDEPDQPTKKPRQMHIWAAYAASELKPQTEESKHECYVDTNVRQRRFRIAGTVPVRTHQQRR